MTVWRGPALSEVEGAPARVLTTPPSLVFSGSLPQNLFHPHDVLLGINAHGVEGRFSNVDRHSVFQEAQLFQPLAALQRRFLPKHEPVQSPLAMPVDSEVLVVSRMRAVAIEGNRGARKIERGAGSGRHALDRKSKRLN